MMEDFIGAYLPLILLIIFLILVITVAVFFLLTQQRTLQAISAPNRLMSPANVWLQIIPVFNFYWMFVVVNKISASIALEYERLHIDYKEVYPTRSSGFAMNIFYIISLVPSQLVQGFASFGTLGFFIIYWIKLNASKKKILINQDNDLLDAEKALLKQEPTN